MNKEAFLDVVDNFWDFVRHGPWWQRLLLLASLVGAVLFVVWVRPLPSEIKEQHDYMDKSAGALYADGATRFFADRYEFVTETGELRTWTKADWLKWTHDSYERLKERRVVLHRSSESLSFYWTGWNSLVERARVESLSLYDGDVRHERDNIIIFTWEKQRLGWRITRMEVTAEKPDSSS